MYISLIYLVFAASAPPAAEVDFAREVLPILSENCFHCHGPDDSSRKRGLRLDTKEGAFAKRKDKIMLVPGKPDESEVIQRIFDADAPMPPVDSHRKLNEKHKATLKAWVAQGAKWGTHWAYVPLPKTVALPAVKNEKWPLSPIDRFILAKLEAEKLSPASEAERTTWLRRVSLDLTGLPPTLAELDAFLKDGDYEKVVDRLLASPRFGERMATDWLDLARFADTMGYQSDKHQPMWPYRDWVINAFNANMPYDRFATEQLAGDIVANDVSRGRQPPEKGAQHPPGADAPGSSFQSMRLATAFNRLHMQNEEGGIVEEEFRVAYVADRVNTFGTAFLGQTFECTRCHDHKYDPFTQRDYYSLFAAFQNIAESGQTSYFTTAMNTPTLLLTTPEQEAKIAELQRGIAIAEARLKTVRTLSDEEYAEWKKNGGAVVPGFEELIGGDPFGKAKPRSLLPKLKVNYHGDPARVPDANGFVLKLDGENGCEFPDVGHFHRYDPFTLQVTLKAESFEPRAVVLHHSKAPIDAGSRGYEIVLENGHVAFGLHHMWPGNAVKVRTRKPIKRNDWSMVTVTHDGSGTARGCRIFIDNEIIPIDVVADSLTKDIAYGGGEPSLALGYRFRDNGFKNGQVKQVALWSRELTPIEIGALFGQFFFQDTERERREYFFSCVDRASRDRVAQLRDARKELAKFVEPIPEIMVMDELPSAKPAFVLKRGQYDQLGEKVSIDTPKSLPPMEAKLPRNRLGIAQWLTEPSHPLTARVAVNRLWQQMFGRGLVETSDNFGTTGSPPSHPELLDWLARDFVDHGWEMKRTLKQIALSQTYRMSSRTTDEVRAKDPYNLLLSHMSPRRLTAEMLRDQAMFAGGLLKEKLGGLSVFPAQPANLWDEAMGKPKYPQSVGDDLHRRSLYTHWKRTAPPPMMTTFDAADRQNCAARRQSTSTPLQALVLLNDPQMLECAEALSTKEIPEIFRTLTGRMASEAEMKVLNAMYDEQREMLGSKEKARVQVALALLNHDACVNRR